MKTRNKTKDLTQYTQIKLIDCILREMRDKELCEASIEAAKPYIQAFAERIHVSEDAAMIFAAFFDRFTDSRIRYKDIANFYDCNQVTILTYWSAINEMVERQFLNEFKDSDGEQYYSVPNDVIEAIRENKPFTPKNFAGIPLEQWLGELWILMEKKDHSRISYDKFEESLMQLVHGNPQLVIAREMAMIKDKNDLIIFAAMANLYIQNHDEHVMRTDLEDLFEHRWVMRNQAQLLECGSHPLQKAGLVEFSISDGQAEKDAWMLTKTAKERFLVGIETSHPSDDHRHVLSPDTITPKPLFFNAAVTRQIEQLESLLQPGQFTRVQDNLTRHGMRRGFACIFYGAPGTGKTETVLQLARKTGRGIMTVDIPNLRSKWVGDTEKNTKAIFERYRNYCQHADLAPILLFNEADAILCKRKEGAESSVDKMENAMQNIILQELETLDGILIATTNLTGNLDTAFERRFLYKIEFPKPAPEQSKHIWHTMLPEISEAQAYELARQYAFSGGQIENIARKQIVQAVLTGNDQLGIEAIQEACRNELFMHSDTRRIGFC